MGYVFRDPALESDGVAELRLKPGADGRASMVLRGRGRGPALDLPALPLAPSERVVAQLRTGEGECWSGDYTAPALKNDARRFADSSD